MTVDKSDAPVPLLLRSWLARLAELLNVCAAYLGIAVLVAVAMIATISPLRDQAKNIHQSLLVALRPTSVDRVLYAMLAAGNDENQALLEGVAGHIPNSGQAGAGAEASSASAADKHNFARLLRSSIEEGVVPGITPAQERALRSYIARKYRVASSVAGALINTAFVVAEEMALDPQLILAVIAIESRYNPY